MTITPVTAQTPLSEQVAEEIRVLLVRRRKSGRDLARDLGVSPAWISYRLSGKQPIDLNDLQRIAAALGVRVVDLLPRAAREPGSQTTGPYLNRHEQSGRMKDHSHSRPRDSRPNGHPFSVEIPPVQRRPARLPRPGQRKAA